MTSVLAALSPSCGGLLGSLALDLVSLALTIVAVIMGPGISGTAPAPAPAAVAAFALLPTCEGADHPEPKERRAGFGAGMRRPAA